MVLVKEMIDNEILKNCPFCMGRGEISEYSKNQYTIVCGNCGVETVPRLTIKEAVESWNCRAYELLHELIQEYAMMGYSRAETLSALKK